MDMYQKREIRRNKKMDESTKGLPSTSINWVIRIYGNTLQKLDKSRVFVK